MRFVNLTPHPVRVFDPEGKNLLAEYPASGQPARCRFEMEPIEVVDGVTLYNATPVPFGVPAPEEDTILIVSMIVRESLRKRFDLASPGEPILGQDGKSIGCKGLVLNTRPKSEENNEGVV